MTGETKVSFVCSEEYKSVFKSLGLNARGVEDIRDCVLAVGDTIRFPENASLVFEVAHRHLSIEKDGPRWMLFLRATKDPLGQPELLLPSRN